MSMFWYLHFGVFIKRLCEVTFILLFFFKQKTAYEMSASLVGSEMCIRDRTTGVSAGGGVGVGTGWIAFTVISQVALTFPAFAVIVAV